MPKFQVGDPVVLAEGQHGTVLEVTNASGVHTYPYRVRYQHGPSGPIQNDSFREIDLLAPDAGYTDAVAGVYATLSRDLQARGLLRVWPEATLRRSVEAVVAAIVIQAQREAAYRQDEIR